jgi:hypothetical protein
MSLELLLKLMYCSEPGFGLKWMKTLDFAGDEAVIQSLLQYSSAG